MSEKTAKTPKEETYWLPQYGISVQASGYEEAIKKAKEMSK